MLICWFYLSRLTLLHDLLLINSFKIKYMAVHVSITRKVLPGKEIEFTEALRKFLGDSFLHEGVHGAGMITAMPGSGGREIGILRTFKDKAERDAFYTSEA